MATVLLTGGTGFIGSHTAVELMCAGESVILADNLANSDKDVVKRIEKITGKEVRFYQADAADNAAMSRIFSENQIDAVIHFAGYKAVGESVRKPLMYYRNNIDTMLTLLEVMQKNKSGYNYKYVTDEEILAKVTAFIDKYGLSLIPNRGRHTDK